MYWLTLFVFVVKVYAQSKLNFEINDCGKASLLQNSPQIIFNSVSKDSYELFKQTNHQSETFHQTSTIFLKIIQHKNYIFGINQTNIKVFYRNPFKKFKIEYKKNFYIINNTDFMVSRRSYFYSSFGTSLYVGIKIGNRNQQLRTTESLIRGLFSYEKSCLVVTEDGKVEIIFNNIFENSDYFTLTSNRIMQARMSSDESYLFTIEERANSFFSVVKYSLQNKTKITEVYLYQEEPQKFSVNDYNHFAIVMSSTTQFFLCSFQMKHLSHCRSEVVSSRIEDLAFRNVSFLSVYYEKSQTNKCQFTIYNFNDIIPSEEEKEQNKEEIQYPKIIIFPDEKIYPAVFKQKSSISNKTLLAILSFPCAKQLLKILNPVYLFLDDFWFYTYHQRSYSNVTKTTLDLIRELNEAKITPTLFRSFTSILKTFFSLPEWEQSNYLNYSPQLFVENTKMQVNFVKNIERLVLYGFLYCAIAFGIIKLMRKTWIVKIPFMGPYLAEKKRIGFLAIVLLENNLQYFSFLAFLQLTLPFQFYLEDKVKIIITSILIFVLLIYSIAVYLLVFFICKLKSYSIFLSHQPDHQSTFYRGAVLITLRSLFTGFVHGFLINNPEVQTYCILSVDVLSILVTMKYWQASISSVYNILYIFYYLCKFGLDIMILNEIGLKYSMVEFQYYLIISLLVSLLFMFFWEITLFLRQLLVEKPDEEDQFQQPKVKKKEQTGVKQIPNQINANVEELEICIDKNNEELPLATFLDAFNLPSSELNFIKKRNRVDKWKKKVFKADMRN